MPNLRTVKHSAGVLSLPIHLAMYWSLGLGSVNEGYLQILHLTVNKFVQNDTGMSSCNSLELLSANSVMDELCFSTSWPIAQSTRHGFVPAARCARRIPTCRAQRRASVLRCSAVANSTTAAEPVGVLMVCLGNICRSPAAEVIFRRCVEVRGLGDQIHVDSCGTGGGREHWYIEGVPSFHEGEVSDARMIEAAADKGYEITNRSRPLRRSDFSRFRYIVAMDVDNIEAIQEARVYWGVERDESQILMLLNYTTDPVRRGRSVPNPYNGDDLAFVKALKQIQDGCDGLLDEIVRREGITT